MQNKIIAVLLTILCIELMFVVSIAQIQPETLLECKEKAWDRCDMPEFENMDEACYKIYGKNTTKWNHCPEVLPVEADCWNTGVIQCHKDYNAQFQ